MQTYTHGVLGAMAGAIFFPHDPIAQVACTAGAMAPDGPTFLIYVREKRGGGVYNQSKLGRVDWAFVNASHSFVVWAIIVLAALGLGWLRVPAVQAFLIGAIVYHVFVDTLTHNTKKSGMIDSEYLWPFGTFLIPFAWEYRTGEDYLLPKPFEAGVLLTAFLVTILLHLR